MQKERYQFSYEVYDSAEELGRDDAQLFRLAQDATSISYAPYSQFNVGAAGRMENGEIVTGGNQENASFPAGLCAEGVVMAVASSRFPGKAMNTLAISYRSVNTKSDHPVAPCGICRQSLQEFQERTGSVVRLVIGGAEGKIFIVPDATSLLPLAFTKAELNR
jgi:cytidine deaminase